MKSADLRLALRMLGWRLTLPILCRFIRLERLVRWLAPNGRAHARDVRREDSARRLARRLWRDSQGTCLERSLALYVELGRLGAQPALVLGFSRPEDDFVGHAWVEVDGRPLLESSDPRDAYVQLVRFATGGARLAGTGSAAGGANGFDGASKPPQEPDRA